MTSDAVSIVMPAYNSAAFIIEAIDSVHKQTWKHWSLIVVDDCSSDGTNGLARAAAERDPRIKVVGAPKNGGTSAARNLGLSQCTGPYVAFLDADDIWMPRKLERQLEFMVQRRASLSFTAYRKFTASRSSGVITARPTVSWHDMLKGNRIGCSTVMLDRRAFGAVEFPTSLGRQEDYALWLSLLRHGGVAHGLDEPLVMYRVHKASKSASKLRSITAQWRVYRELEKLSRSRAAWYWSHYAVRGVMKALR